MAAAVAIPVTTSEVPVLSGDVLRSVKTPAVSPPSDSAAVPPSSTTNYTIDATSVINALSTRRLSAGAQLAEQIGIDLNAIGKSEARKIMSVEHKVLGFRPPQGSLAAEAQAAAAKHPEVPNAHLPDAETLKEAAKVDAERILAERAEAEKTGVKGASAVQPTIDGEPVVDLNNITEEEARKLMSHEHRALGFRPPPGSLAAEAQAAAAKLAEGTKVRRNPNEDKKPANGTNAKPRRMSNDPKQRRGSNDSTGKPRRGSNESVGKQRRGSDVNGKPRRGSNEKRTSGEMRRTNSDQANGAKVNGSATQRRASSHVNGLSAATKEELLREAALRDAERIKATRGVNGTTATENAHVDVQELSKPVNLPGPAQVNVDREAKDHSTITTPTETSQSQAAEVVPGELEHETPIMSRSETTDSVQIIGDIIA